MTEIKNNILHKIKEEQLKPRPKLYFTLKIILLVVVSLLILGISISILHFILFSIRINSQDELLGFGPRGIWAFLRFFPWAWLILDLIAIAFLQKLLRHFKFGYRLPVLYLLIGIFFVTIFIGFVLPTPFEPIYRRHHLSPPRNGICRCTIVDLYQNKMVVADNRFGTTTLLTVILPLNDPHATTTNLMKGDTIFIAGELKDGVIQAFGVKKLMRTMPR